MKKRNNNGVLSYVVTSLIVAFVVIGGTAWAYSLTQNIDVDGDYNYYEATQLNPPEVELGAMASPDFYTDYISVNGLEIYVKNDVLRDATTTPIRVPNPLGATTTLSKMIVDISGAATTSISFYCGTSTPTSGVSAADTNIIGLSQLGTSTVVYVDSDGTAQTNWYGGSNIATWGTVVDSLLLLPGEEIVCTIANNGSADLGGVTGNSNTFAGKFIMEFTRKKY